MKFDDSRVDTSGLDDRRGGGGGGLGGGAIGVGAGGLGVVVLIIALVLGIAAAWALIPPAAIRSAWVAERAGVYAVAGAGEGALFGRTLDDLEGALASDFRGLLGDVRSIGQGPWDPAGFSDWLQSRVVVTWLWVGLIAYRLQVLMGWLLPGMPLTMAA